MMLVRFLINLIGLIVELVAIAGIAWLGYRHPYLAGLLAAGLAFILGLMLERSRLLIEIGYYFGRPLSRLSWAAASVALMEALVKAMLAGVVTLVTFSGTNDDRRLIVAIVFGVCLFAGSSILRRLSILLRADPSRWGYFRLAAPLGLLFSATLYVMTLLQVLPRPSFTELAGQLVLNTPVSMTLESASELMFMLKQKFDDIMMMILGTFLPAQWAEAATVLVSVNVLTGFAIAVFSVAIAEIVRRIETVGG